VFFPDNPYLLFWLSINFIFIFYYVSFIPYFIAFNIEHYFWRVIENISDVYFIIDVILNFNIAFKKENGEYEISWIKIIKRYLSTYFLIDALTSIPFGLIMETHSNSFNVSYNKIFWILKLPKLVRTLKMTWIFRLSRVMKSFKLGAYWRFKIKVYDNFLKTFYLMIVTFFLLHLGACVFIIIGNSR